MYLMKSGPFDIVIVPPRNINGQAIELSHSLAAWDTYFTLDEAGPFPHISLYQTEFPLDNLEAVKSKLLLYSKHKKSFNIQPVEGTYRKEDKDFVEVQYEPSKELYKLHTEIRELLNPLRNGLMRARDKERLNQVSEIQRENLENWGYRLTGSEFRPHLSLTRLKNPDAMSVSNIQQKDFNFNVGQIGIYDLGEHGTCIRKVATYDLLN
jgi:hypothetical protein